MYFYCINISFKIFQLLREVDNTCLEQFMILTIDVITFVGIKLNTYRENTIEI